MDKFIPYEKLSKKKRRELDRLHRGSWNSINPVTRKTANGKVYNRKKARKIDYQSAPCFFIFSERYRNEMQLL